MRKRPCHDEVNPARQVARDIWHGFSCPETNVRRREVHCVSTKLHYARFKRDTCAQAWLFKNHCQRLTSKQRVRPPFFAVGLQPARESEDLFNLFALQIGKTDE